MEIKLKKIIVSALVIAHTSLGMGQARYTFDQSLDGLYILSPGLPHSISISKQIKKSGTGAVRFELRAGETRVNKKGKKSFRSELSTEQYVKIGSVNWYRFSIYIPKNFPIEKNRLVIAQWWSPKDPGEKSKSPALAFRYVNGKLYISMRHSSQKIISKGSGEQKILWEEDGYQRGHWRDFVVQVKWSYMKDGFVNIWQDGRSIVKYKGSLGYNDESGPAFQFGIYRDNSKETYVVYFDEYEHCVEPGCTKFESKK
jgi:hypothetical protein